MQLATTFTALACAQAHAVTLAPQHACREEIVQGSCASVAVVTAGAAYMYGGPLLQRLVCASIQLAVVRQHCARGHGLGGLHARFTSNYTITMFRTA
jgi:hypothetical protein